MAEEQRAGIGEEARRLYQQDLTDWEKHWRETIYWYGLCKKLQTNCRQLTAGLEKLLAQFSERMASFQGSLEEKEFALLENRSQGIRLSLKILRRAEARWERLEDLSVNSLQAPLSPERALAQAASADIFASWHQENYRRIKLVRDKGLQYRKFFLNAVSQGILPAVDGFGAGREQGEALLREQYSVEFLQSLTQLMFFYPEAEKMIKEMFNAVRIREIPVSIKDPFDELLHEPLGVIEEPKEEANTEAYVEVDAKTGNLEKRFGDEWVGQIMRRGYLYMALGTPAEELVLRPVQVMVSRGDKGVRK